MADSAGEDAAAQAASAPFSEAPAGGSRTRGDTQDPPHDSHHSKEATHQQAAPGSMPGGSNPSAMTTSLNRPQTPEGIGRQGEGRERAGSSRPGTVGRRGSKENNNGNNPSNKIDLFDTRPKLWKDKLKSHKDSVVFAQFLEEKLLLSISADGGLRIWDLWRRKIAKKVELFAESESRKSIQTWLGLTKGGVKVENRSDGHKT
jgi:hypothetical protein